ncbi:hypothetical protein [Fimbriiglobus ruber]|uniref:TIGR03067 domain-containing protein n=1 Tax=Fimbriiglobus ruber TaxID=1908690 RepID=A0A225E5H6_9BACT|nr:hypothetical protein [Fimbriiglobus ruber]OWK43677.1 hypothetical protein FRUB_03276 [Fimbriiglobus ruber]
MMSLLFMALSIAAPVPKDKPKFDDKKLEGVWKATTRDTTGRPRPLTPTLAPSYTLVIIGGEYAFRNHSGTIAVDPEKMIIDMKATNEQYKDMPCPGAFERTGDTLRIAMPHTPRVGAERPKELRANPQTATNVITFELDKTVTADQAVTKLKEMKEAGPRAANPFGNTPVRGGLPADVTTQQMLQKVLDKLDKIEKRLDDLEKKN